MNDRREQFTAACACLSLSLSASPPFRVSLYVPGAVFQSFLENQEAKQREYF